MEFFFPFKIDQSCFVNFVSEENTYLEYPQQLQIPEIQNTFQNNETLIQSFTVHDVQRLNFSSDIEELLFNDELSLSDGYFRFHSKYRPSCTIFLLLTISFNATKTAITNSGHGTSENTQFLVIQRRHKPFSNLNKTLLQNFSPQFKALQSETQNAFYANLAFVSFEESEDESAINMEIHAYCYYCPKNIGHLHLLDFKPNITTSKILSKCRRVNYNGYERSLYLLNPFQTSNENESVLQLLIGEGRDNFYKSMRNQYLATHMMYLTIVHKLNMTIHLTNHQIEDENEVYWHLSLKAISGENRMIRNLLANTRSTFKTFDQLGLQAMYCIKNSDLVKISWDIYLTIFDYQTWLCFGFTLLLYAILYQNPLRGIDLAWIMFDMGLWLEHPRKILVFYLISAIFLPLLHGTGVSTDFIKFDIPSSFNQIYKSGYRIWTNSLEERAESASLMPKYTKRSLLKDINVKRVEDILSKRYDYIFPTTPQKQVEAMANKKLLLPKGLEGMFIFPSLVYALSEQNMFVAENDFVCGSVSLTSRYGFQIYETYQIRGHLSSKFLILISASEAAGMYGHFKKMILFQKALIWKLEVEDLSNALSSATLSARTPLEKIEDENEVYWHLSLKELSPESKLLRNLLANTRSTYKTFDQGALKAMYCIRSCELVKISWDIYLTILDYPTWICFGITLLLYAVLYQNLLRGIDLAWIMFDMGFWSKHPRKILVFYLISAIFLPLLHGSGMSTDFITFDIPSSFNQIYKGGYRIWTNNLEAVEKSADLWPEYTKRSLLKDIDVKRVEDVLSKRYDYKFPTTPREQVEAMAKNKLLLPNAEESLRNFPSLTHVLSEREVIVAENDFVCGSVSLTSRYGFQLSNTYQIRGQMSSKLLIWLSALEAAGMFPHFKSMLLFQKATIWKLKVDDLSRALSSATLAARTPLEKLPLKIDQSCFVNFLIEENTYLEYPQQLQIPEIQNTFQNNETNIQSFTVHVVQRLNFSFDVEELLVEDRLSLSDGYFRFHSKHRESCTLFILLTTSFNATTTAITNSGHGTSENTQFLVIQRGHKPFANQNDSLSLSFSSQFKALEFETKNAFYANLAFLSVQESVAKSTLNMEIHVYCYYCPENMGHLHLLEFKSKVTTSSISSECRRLNSNGYERDVYILAPHVPSNLNDSNFNFLLGEGRDNFYKSLRNHYLAPHVVLLTITHKLNMTIPRTVYHTQIEAENEVYWQLSIKELSPENIMRLNLLANTRSTFKTFDQVALKAMYCIKSSELVKISWDIYLTILDYPTWLCFGITLLLYAVLYQNLLRALDLAWIMFDLGFWSNHPRKILVFYLIGAIFLPLVHESGMSTDFVNLENPSGVNQIYKAGYRLWTN
ncbi:unnamed protein product [Orchesella dallaii]|uniref:Uncharacterized protein n=1 Tax=Orchesella dallaii TaxID=48710 RepID=A0ABP1PI06_9HEXA